VDKNKERAFKREIARLRAAGALPSLSEVTEAVRQAQVKFGPRIRRARREYRNKISIN
jgi:hypothetical protein